MNFCGYVKNIGLPLVISPILWPAGDLSGYPMEEIRTLLHTSDIALPNSDMEGDLLADVFNIERDKFHTVYNGIDRIFIDDDESTGDLFRNEYNIDGDFILFVGNIEKRKNQVNVARAVRNSGLNVVMLGNIRDKNFYKEMMNESGGNIRYLGYLPHDSGLLRSAYRACDLFILPTMLETPGLAALEAAAMGTKIVVTREGSTREYFEDMVTYVNPLSPEDILSGIQKELGLTRDTALQKHVREKFTWENTARQTLSAYRHVLENR